MPMFSKLLAERNVALLRRLIPEVIAHVGGELPDVISRVLYADFILKLFGDLGVIALAVKKLDELPLFRRKAIEVRGAAHVGDDDGNAILDLLFGDEFGVELLQALSSRLVHWKFGEGRIEGFRQIHERPSAAC